MTERSDPANRGYAICTSGRSGSNLLCQYLSSTGMLGNPLEYFNGSGRRLLGYPEYPDDPSGQIDWILTTGATPNGIYGLKIFPAQAEVVEKSIRWTELLPDLKFVLFKRRDMLGQAISAVRALQTEQWRASMPARGPAMYDGAQIYERLQSADNHRLREFAGRSASGRGSSRRSLWPPRPGACGCRAPRSKNSTRRHHGGMAGAVSRRISRPYRARLALKARLLRPKSCGNRRNWF
jgi:hypothetical protein